jgi:thioredoxin reductase (NADPH)
MQKMQGHAKDLGAEIKEMEKIVDIKKENDNFSLTTESGHNFLSKNILLATGTKHRKLSLPDEDKYIGRGVAYCALCDAMFFRDKVVAVVGGGNSAMTASLYLAEVAQKVYLLVKGNELSGEMVWAEQIEKNSKIEIKYQSEVIKLKGDDKLEGVDLKSNSKEEIEALALDGLFVEIGTQPDPLLSEKLGLDTDRGYIKVDSAQKTNVAGVWAAGDITTNSNSVRQVITACSEGAVATQDIFSLLQKNK